MKANTLMNDKNKARQKKFGATSALDLLRNASSAIHMIPKPYQTVPRQQNVENKSQSHGYSSSQKTLIRPKTSVMLPPRDSRRFQIKERNDVTPMAAQHHLQVNTLMITPITSGAASQEEQSVSSPQFQISTAPKIRRPVSAIRNKIGSNEVVQSALPSLLRVASLNPMLAGVGGKSPVVLLKPVRGASAITRYARSVSSIFQDTARSSTWTKTRKRKKGTGKKASKKSNAGQTAQLNKKFARNHKYVVQQIDNFTKKKDERRSSRTAESMQYVAAPEVKAVPQQQPLEDPSRYPMLATTINGELNYRQQESPEVAHQLESGADMGSGRDPQQLVYMVYNYYGGHNNHNYTPASAQAQANQNQLQQEQQQQQNEQRQQQQPFILAQNQEPMGIQQYMQPTEEVQRLGDEAGDLTQPQELQQRKRQLMTRKMPKKPRKHPVLTKVPIPVTEDVVDQLYDQNQSLKESDSDHDFKLLNCSQSVDTSDYMRHLQRKGKNFDLIRGLSKSLDRDGNPSPNLSILERQMYVMQFLENAPTRNPFRSLKIKGLIDKHGRTAKKELQQMLQQEEDWASLSAAAYSDEDDGYARLKKKRSRDHNDLGNFYVKDDLKQYSKLIQQNNHYKKLQQLKASQHEGVKRSKSKSPSHFSSSSPILNQNSKAAFGISKRYHPLARSKTHGKNVGQLQLKRQKSEKELAQSGDRNSQSRHRRSRSKKSIRNRQTLRNFHDVEYDSPSSPQKKKARKRLSRHSVPKHYADQNENSKFRIEENNYQHSGRDIYEDVDRSQNGSLAISDETQPQVIQQDPLQQRASIDRNVVILETPTSQHLEDISPIQASQEMIDHYKKIIHNLEQNQHQIRRRESIDLRIEDVEQSLSQPGEHHQHSLQPNHSDEHQYLTYRQSPYQERQHELHLRGQNRHQSDQSIAVDTLQTIQQNKKNEEMQSSQKSDGMAGRDQSFATSLMTESGIVSDLMSASQADNTPKSVYQLLQTPTKGLATIKEQIDDAKFEGTAQSDQHRYLGQQASASTRLAFANAFSPTTFQAATATPTDIANSEFENILRFPESSNPQQVLSPAPSRHRMFDIGEPSQTSEKVIAMLDLNLDQFLKITSQRSSSMAGAHTDRVINSGTAPTRINQANKNKNNSTVTRDCKAGSNVKSLQQEQQKQPQHKDSSQSLSGSRPPLLKMRTQITQRKERNKHTLSKHDMIEGSKGNGSVSGGGHFLSEQQNSKNHKTESSAKVTSKGQTWQAISVHQILAGSAAQNESTQALQQQMGSVLSAANNGNGKLPSVEEQYNDASPTQQLIQDHGGFDARVQQIFKEKMQIEEKDVNPSCNVEKLSCSITDSFVEDTITSEQETDKLPAATHTDHSLGVVISPILHEQDDGLLSKPSARRASTNSPDTSQHNLLSMINVIENRLTDQKRQRKIYQSNVENVEQEQEQNAEEEKVQTEMKPKIIFQPELTEAGTQTLKNMGAQTESESPKRLEQQQEQELIRSQSQDPRLPFHTVKEENSIITDSPQTNKTPTHKLSSSLQRQGTISCKADEQIEVNRLVCEAAETTRLAQKLLEQQTQQMVLYQKQQEQLQEQSHQQNQIQQLQLKKQQDLTNRRGLINSCEPILNAEQSQVIICSPFEQDMFEMLAIAAVMPKAQMHYTEVAEEEVDLTPITHDLQHDDDNAVKMLYLFEYNQNETDDVKNSIDHRLTETPIEILKGLCPEKRLKPSEADETSQIISENLSTPRTRSHQVTINIDGMKFQYEDLLIKFKPAVLDEDESVAMQSERQDRKKIIVFTDVESKLHHNSIMESPFEYLPESSASAGHSLDLASELSSDAGDKNNFPTYVTDPEKIVPQKIKRRKTKSSNQLPKYKKKQQKSSFAKIKSGKRRNNSGEENRQMRESLVRSSLKLKRHAKSLQTKNSSINHERVKEDYENERLKVLSRFVDAFQFEKTKSDVQEDNLEEILEMSYEQLHSSHRSYQAIEMDSFGFEKFTFSIVNAQKLYWHEHRILYSNNWGIRLHRQNNLQQKFTKYATLSLLSQQNNLQQNSLIKKPAFMKKSSIFSSDQKDLIEILTPDSIATNNESKSNVFENNMRTMNKFSPSGGLVRSDSIRSLKLINSVNDRMGKLQSQQQISGEYKPAIQYNIVDWLAAEYPIVLSQDEKEPSSVNQKKLFYLIPRSIIVQAQNIEDIRKMTIFDNQQTMLTKQDSASRSSTQRRMLSQFKRVTSKNKLRMTNKWLLASIYFNDLKHNDVSQDGHSSYVMPSQIFSKWLMVDNANLHEILYDLDQRAAAHSDAEAIMGEPAGEKISYRVMLRNKHYRSAQLSKDGIFTIQGDLPQIPLYNVRLSTKHFTLLLELMNKSCYVSYSNHLWCVSQANKQHYANQCVRAQSFFASAIQHSQVGKQHIYNESHATMRAFMRRSTMRQEIQDILSVKSSILLLDEEYVKRDKRKLLIEKIRLTIQSCEADQSKNEYQHSYLMQELEDIVKKRKEKQNDRQVIKLKQKAQGHIQFSKSLIFINFHPQGEGKRWIHQDYMNRLMNCDQETPRYYGDYMRQVLDCETRKLKLEGFSSQVKMAEQMLFSTREPKIAQKNQFDSFYSVFSKEKQEKDKQHRFPFILNDYFGYSTLMLTDGCYQILVPVRPDCSDRRLKLSNNLTARSGLAALRKQSYEISVSPLDETMQSNSLLYLEGESSPMTPATPVTFTDVMYGQQLNSSDGFSKRIQTVGRNDKLQTYSAIQLLQRNSKSSLTVHDHHRDGTGTAPFDKLLSCGFNSPPAPVQVAMTFAAAVENDRKNNKHPSTSKRTTQQRKSLNVSIINEQQHQIKKAKTQIDKVLNESFTSQFSFSMSEEDKYENSPKTRSTNQQLKMSSNHLKVPVSRRVSQDHLPKKTGPMRFDARKKKSGNISHGSDRSHSEQSIESSSAQVMFHFQRKQTQLAFKRKNIKQSKTPDLNMMKNRSQDRQDGNIKRRIINSIEQLKNTRMPVGEQKRLLLLKFKPQNERKRMNISSLSPDMRSMRTSPQKQQNGRLSNKNITIIKKMDLQSTVDANLASSVNKKHQDFKNAIKLNEDEKRHPSILAQTLLVLRNLQIQTSPTTPFDHLGTDEDKTRQESPSSNCQSQIQLVKRMQVAVNNEVNSMGTQSYIKQTFYTYQVSKLKERVSLLTIKSPKARIREKQEYDKRLEAMERDKVFMAIEFKQIQVIEDYIKCHMLGVDVTDGNGNTLLSMAAQFGGWDICNMLIKGGANVNSHNKLGNTPLHYAIAYKRQDIVDLLIESGANETIKNKSRLTPWQGV